MSAVVVKLPTAAPRKVENGRWAQQRRAGSEMRRKQGAFHFPIHHNREAVIRAERLADFMEARLPMTPEIAVIIGLVQLLNADQIAQLVNSVMASGDALTLVELARADQLTRHLIWAVLQRRGLA